MPMFSPTSEPKSPTTTRKLKSFKREKSFADRKAEYTRVRNKYPDMIPVICERHHTNTTLPQSERRKYLVPQDITMGQFKYVIRKRIKMRPDMAMFIFVDASILCPTNTTIGEMYKEHQDEDGFMYLVYSGESTFGYMGPTIQSVGKKPPSHHSRLHVMCTTECSTASVSKHMASSF